MYAWIQDSPASGSACLGSIDEDGSKRLVALARRTRHSTSEVPAQSSVVKEDYRRGVEEDSDLTRA
jgi:hypothetical protein